MDESVHKAGETPLRADMHSSRLVDRRLGQLSVRTLLLIMTLFACFMGVYIGYWEAAPVAPALFTSLVASSLGMSWQRKRHYSGLSGAATGGAAGGIVAVVLHFGCGYMLDGSFQDDAVRFILCVWAFAPVGLLCGAVIGVLVWTATSAFLWMLKRVPIGVHPPGASLP